MIQWFKRNDLYSLVALFPYTVILRLAGLIAPESYATGQFESFINVLIFNHWIPGAIIQTIVAILLVYAQAVLINFLANQHRMLFLPGSAPGFMYVLLASLLPAFQGLSPALIGMTFVILAAANLFNVYKNISPAAEIFNAAFFISIAALFYLPYAIAVIPLLIELSILRGVGLKERLQFLLGFVALFWIAGSVLYYLERIDLLPFDTLSLPGSISELMSTGWEGLKLLLPVIILVGLSLFNYYNYMKKKGIEARKKIDFFYWLMLSVLISMFFFTGLNVHHLLFLAFPLALFLGMSLVRMHNVVLAELIHIGMVAVLFYLHFGEHIN